MSSESISRLVKSVADQEPATVKLTNTAGERTTFKCLFKAATAPHFFVIFPSRNLLTDIDLSKPVPFISKDYDGRTLSFAAEIVAKTDDNVLQLAAVRTINPEDLREYFRVSISTNITVSFQPPKSKSSQPGWILNGTVVDLSQSGVLALFPEKCQNEKSLFISIDLTSPARTISCIGHVVRVKKTGKNRWATALHFDNITTKAVDDIALTCFAEQRKQLRENIEARE